MLVNYATWKRLNENIDEIDSSGATLIVMASGSKEWWLDGQRHRVDGPAVELASGSKWWYLNGKRHRVDGPAIKGGDGSKWWYIDGKELTYDEFIQRLNDILDGRFAKKGEIIVTKADIIKGIIPDIAEIKTILGIRDSNGELESALDRSEDLVGLVKTAKAIAAVFGGDINIVKWLKTELQNTFNGSEIDMIVNYFHKNTFELEGLDSLFGHSDDADW